MSRRRMIWRESLSDSDLGRSTDSERLLWDALIVLADDDGRGIADPDFLRAEIWRYHPRRTGRWVEKTLRSLARKMPNLRLYEVKGRSYYMFDKWTDYQKIRKDLHQQSKIPSPPLRTSTEAVTIPPQDRNAPDPQGRLSQSQESSEKGQTKEGGVVENQDRLAGRLFSISQNIRHLPPEDHRALITQYLTGFVGVGERPGEECLISEWDHLTKKIASGKDVKNWPAYSKAAVQKYHKERVPFIPRGG